MFQSVLVPLDGTTDAESALPFACSIARHAGATLRLVRVLPDLADEYFWAPMPGSSGEADLRKHDYTAVQEYLQSVAKRIEGHGAPSVLCDVVPEEEDISQSIRRDAVRKGADLIVMINHGRGVLGRFLHGSVADQLLRMVDIPVLLVPPKPAAADLNCDASFRHILVALDGTPESEQMLDPALAIGQAMGADLTLIRVVPGPSAEPNQPPPTAAEVDQLRADAPRYLEAVAQRLRAAGAAVQTRLLVGTQPASALLKESSTDEDLLALETEGRKGLARLLHPSVVDQVVRESVHPVLLLRRSVRSPVKA